MRGFAQQGQADEPVDRAPIQTGAGILLTDLRTLTRAGGVQALVIDLTPAGRYRLFARLGNGRESVAVLTQRRSPREWVRLETLLAHLKDASLEVAQLHIPLTGRKPAASHG